MRYIIIYLIVLLFSITLLNAQPSKIDSLKSVLKTLPDDTVKINTLNALAAEYKSIEPDSAIKIYQNSCNLAQKLREPVFEGKILYTISDLYWRLGELDSAVVKCEKSILIWNKLLNKKTIDSAETQNIEKLLAASLGVMGNVYNHKGEFAKALEYYFKALKLDEKLGNIRGIAIKTGNIGAAYKEMLELHKAIEYFNKSLVLREQIADAGLIASCLVNLGNTYSALGDNEKALFYFNKALALAEQTGDKYLISIQSGSIAITYERMAEKADSLSDINTRNTFKEKALSHYLKALSVAREINNKSHISSWAGNIGLFYYKAKQFAKAESFMKEALSVSSEMGAINIEKDHHEFLSNLYEAIGKHQLALYHYKRHVELRDSIFNEENQKALVEKEMQYEYEKKEAELNAEQEKKEAIALAEKKRQQLFMYLIGAIAVAIAIIALVVYRSLNITKKQKELIEHQKQLVEEKQKEILDSIHYAKRIQQALITPELYIERKLRLLKKT
jgi:tetratricopeptide (TPR) repeat protein